MVETNNPATTVIGLPPDDVSVLDLSGHHRTRILKALSDANITTVEELADRVAHPISGPPWKLRNPIKGIGYSSLWLLVLALRVYYNYMDEESFKKRFGFAKRHR
ncbi:MAG TPA: hypothetical protein VGN17_00330 [Bryobacteraceae bacterium]|jgi:hypothetical protein